MPNSLYFKSIPLLFSHLQFEYVSSLQYIAIIQHRPALTKIALMVTCEMLDFLVYNEWLEPQVCQILESDWSNIYSFKKKIYIFITGAQTIVPCNLCNNNLMKILLFKKEKFSVRRWLFNIYGRRLRYFVSLASRERKRKRLVRERLFITVITWLTTGVCCQLFHNAGAYLKNTLSIYKFKFMEINQHSQVRCTLS